MTCETLQGKYAEKLEREKKKMNKEIEMLYKKLDAQDAIIDQQTLEIARLKNQSDRALSFIGILHNNLKDYTEYQEYTNIFNEMLKDIEEILGDKE